MADVFHEMIVKSWESQTNGSGDHTILYLSGPPATCKTEMTSTSVEGVLGHFMDKFILANFMPVDMGGLWVPDHEKGRLRQYNTDYFLGDIPGAEGSEYTCIFIDEMSNASPDTQTSLLTTIESRQHNGRKVPDNVWFVAAGNRPEDGTGSNKLIKSLESRLTVIDYDDDYINGPLKRSWLEWASDGGNIHPIIRTFLEYKDERGFFYDFDPKRTTFGWPSPRTWTKFSRWLDLAPSKEAELAWAKANLGEDVYREYQCFIDVGMNCPRPADIIDDPAGTEVPIKADCAYATLANLAAYLKDRDFLSTHVVDSAITYLRRFDDSFSVFGFRMMAKSHKDFSDTSSEYAKFLVDHQYLSI